MRFCLGNFGQFWRCVHLPKSKSHATFS